MTDGISLAIHGGAGPKPDYDYAREENHLRDVVGRGKLMLMDGASALDVVCALVKDLELSGLYLAGMGSAPNTSGEYELDAAVMDGATRRAGAVANLRGFESPVDVARAVMDKTQHVLLAGRGAEAFAHSQEFTVVDDPATYYTPAVKAPTEAGALGHGTVGAVARHRDGRLAAATSTGGVTNTLPGRVGDTPLIGAGTWADERVAVSCTGLGEYFIRAAVAADVSARIRYGGVDLADAAQGAIDDMSAQGGDGGLIAVDAAGRVALPFNSDGMKRAWIGDDGEPRAAVF